MSRYLYRKNDVSFEFISSEKDSHFKLGDGMVLVLLITSLERATTGLHSARWCNVTKIWKNSSRRNGRAHVQVLNRPVQGGMDGSVGCWEDL